VRAPAYVLLVGALLASRVAVAGERARLDLSRGAGAEACPDERALSDAVAARLGYEPFAPDADLRLTVRFRRDGTGLRGSVEIKNADGDIKGERALTSRGDDCQELAAATSFTVSILLDPRSGLGPRKPPPIPAPEPPAVPPTVPEVARPPEPPPPAAEAPPPTKKRLRFRLVAAATGSIGLLPSPSAGVLAGAGIARERWSADLELRADASASKSLGGHTVSASFLGGGVVPCAKWGPARACGVVQLGVIQAAVTDASPETRTSPVLLVGPRVGVSLPLTSWIALDAHADALFAPTQVTVRVDTGSLWSNPVLSGLLGLGVIGSIP